MLPRRLCLARLVLQAAIATSKGIEASPKRGLIDIATKNPSDDQTWIRKGSDLTWYYNYQADPSSAYTSDAKFEFVPMLFGQPDDLSSTETPFLTSIQNQIKAGANITYVLAYNEPDGQSSTGGSDIPADTAASVWMRNIAPLRDQGIKVGLPAVTGSPDGFNWLANFNKSCLAMLRAARQISFRSTGTETSRAWHLMLVRSGRRILSSPSGSPSLLIPTIRCRTPSCSTIRARHSWTSCITVTGIHTLAVSGVMSATWEGMWRF
jgi:hypothetical protein